MYIVWSKYDKAYFFITLVGATCLGDPEILKGPLGLFGGLWASLGLEASSSDVVRQDAMIARPLQLCPGHGCQVSCTKRFGMAVRSSRSFRHTKAAPD